MSKRRLLTGQEWDVVSEEWKARVGKDFHHFNNGLVRIEPNGWIYPGTSPIYLDKIDKFQFRSDDVIVMTYPKCGTTWMQELLWTMLHNPNLDNPRMGEAILDRSLDISQDMLLDSKAIREFKLDSILEGFKQLCPGKKEEDGMIIQMLEVLRGPRIIKCHYPLELMPPDLLENTKVVYVTRNPKDMIISLYYFLRYVKIFDYKGSLEDFTKSIMKHEMIYGSFWQHVQQAWQKRNHPNMHYVFFEDLKTDCMAEIRKLNDFLGTNLTQQQMENATENSTFSNMKSRGEIVKDKGVFNQDEKQKEGGFFRKGLTGDWKNYISPELNEELDKWIKKNVGDIPFKYGN